jgi:hypothetical protein
VELAEKGRIVPDLSNARQAGNFVLQAQGRDRVHRRQPKQLVSVREPHPVP